MTLGIPYMGSKRRLSKRIMDYICAQNPNAKYFYDLFGGGGAISFEALQRKQFAQVTYNELNTGVVELLRKIQREGVTDEFYQWIDRDTFNKHKSDNDWFGGLLKTCWSFGNKQKSYLYGKDVEPLKKSATSYLMANGYDKTVNTRAKLLKEFKEKEKISGRFELERLERLDKLQQLINLESLNCPKQLKILNASYEAVQIDTLPEQTIIYCDPPYEGTAKYAIGLNHREFDCWVQASPYKIYVSGYESKILPCVYEMRHTATLSAKQTKGVIEKLFCNKPENDFFMLI